MRMLRKISSALIIILLTIFINVNIFASDVTEINGARYYVEEEIIRNELSKGVIQHTDISYSSAKECTSTAAGLGSTETFVPDKYYPQQVNVLEIPSSNEIKITPWANINSAGWTLSTVRSMIIDYERDNPGYKVIAAVNGDFFDINGNNNFPYTPNGVHVSDGNFYKSSSTRTVGFKNDGSSDPLVGNEAFTRTEKMILAIFNEENEVIREFTIDNINNNPQDGEISLYYANKDANKKIVPIDVEDGYVVEGAEFALPHSNNDFYGLGKISKKGNATLGAGQFAIVSKNPIVTQALSAGLKIRVQYEFSGDYKNIKDAIGVGETILYNGEYTGADKNRHPRTMIGVKEDGTIIMTIVDGRQSDKGMYGATSAEMAAILSHYGAVEGYNLDGGGSSTMIIVNDGELQVMNSPSDGRERSDSNCLIISVKVPIIEHSVSNVSESSFTINTNIIDKNGFEFDKLYVGIEDEIKEVINGNATFTNLNHNQKYVYQFYRQINGEFIDFGFEGVVYTAKTMPEINYINIYYNNKTLVVEVDMNNPDEAIKKCLVYIGDKYAAVNNGRANFYNFQGSIENIKVELTYDLNDGNGQKKKEITNFRIHLGIDLFLDIAIHEINVKITNIYN